ncbi:MAG: nickel-dependent lactate racemase [Candidatus Cloacimonetes bacterium]|nr:nickel-dependent lactate racemase [Candidatus Cloacimonadota bacterium]
MNYKIKLDNQQVELQIPSDQVEIITFKEVPVFNQEDLIRKSLTSPLDSVDLETFLKDKQKILIIVNDGSRNTPTSLVIATLQEYLKNKDYKFIVALGTHKKPTEEEFVRIFGSFYPLLKDRIICHDAKNDVMLELGQTTRGTKVKFNSEIKNADGIIIISSVEPHYFAGYTGGRKSLLPGIAAFETIEKNHSLALKKSAQILKLEGNPIHEDMAEAVKMIKTDIFCLLSVLNSEDKIFFTTSGNIHSTLKAAAKKVKKVYSPEVKQKADIIIAIDQPPLDLDLYQSQKDLENCNSILNDGGIFILVSRCKQGIGNRTFYDLMATCNSPEEVFQKVEKNYKLGYHKAAKFVSFMRRNKLWLVSEIDDDVLRKIFIEPFNSLQIAVDEAIKIKGKDAKIALINNARISVPRLKTE